jgi:hypothetical protein
MPLLAVIIGFLASAWAAFVAWLGTLWLTLLAGNAISWVLRAVIIAAVVVALPLPEWLTTLPARLATIPAGVVYMLDVCRFKEGLGIVLSAWVLRILVRLFFRVIG